MPVQDPIDLRSDTVTKPSPDMRKAMYEAEVGDDVFGEDPTANLLQEKLADLLGKEKALFVPSGVMGNQLCVKAHTEPGDEVILDYDSHIFNYETTASSIISGVQLHPLPGLRGVVTADQIKQAVRPRAYYLPRTTLVCLENTHNRAGGTVFPLEEIQRIRDLADEAGLKMHLDGARLWNALVATGVPLAEYCKYFDSVSVCFSKGLGAPVGSAIAGSAALIERAHRYRKILGGGMRQIGILAAAAQYALNHNIARLKEDHEKAKYLAQELSHLKTLKIDPASVQTNIVLIDVRETGRSTDEVLKMLRESGVLLTPEKQTIVRAVTHLDVTRAQIEQAVEVFRKLFH